MHPPTRARFLIPFLASILVCGVAHAIATAQQLSVPDSRFSLAATQTCGAHGVAVQVLGSGGPELVDRRASSSYLVWENGKARVLVDAGGGSALRFGESGAQMPMQTSWA